MAQDLLKDVVYRRIRDLIISGALPMGSKISETVLAERLSATKAPVRDALKRLQSEGLVQIKPQSGTFVFSLCNDGFYDLLVFRYHIESKAMELALQKNAKTLIQEMSYVLDKMTTALSNESIPEYLSLDNQYHQVMVSSCGNPYFQESYDLISSRMATARNHMGGNNEHMTRSFNQHIAIVDYLKNGKLEEAQDELKSHVLPQYGAYWDRVTHA